VTQPTPSDIVRIYAAESAQALLSMLARLGVLTDPPQEAAVILAQEFVLKIMDDTVIHLSHQRLNTPQETAP
jgi:hypothetical protein